MSGVRWREFIALVDGAAGRVTARGNAFCCAALGHSRIETALILKRAVFCLAQTGTDDRWPRLIYCFRGHFTAPQGQAC